MSFSNKTILPSLYTVFKWKLKYPGLAWFYLLITLDGGSLQGRALVDVLRLRGRVADKDFLKSKDFSIFLCKKSFLFSYLTWIFTITMASTKVTVLVTDYYIMRNPFFEDRW